MCVCVPPCARFALAQAHFRRRWTVFQFWTEGPQELATIIQLDSTHLSWMQTTEKHDSQAQSILHSSMGLGWKFGENDIMRSSGRAPSRKDLNALDCILRDEILLYNAAYILLTQDCWEDPSKIDQNWPLQRKLMKGWTDHD